MGALEAGRGAGALARDTSLSGRSWSDLKALLYVHDWVVYAKQPLGGPAQVLEYLGRYTHRVAISNERLVDISPQRVRLSVRDASRPKGRRVIELAAEVFINRFLQHILPKGFKRIRHYGLLSPARKARGLADARKALDMPVPVPAVVESVDAFMRRVTKFEWNCCANCRKGRFVVISVIAAAHSAPFPPRGPP
jgi:hypothetical protein